MGYSREIYDEAMAMVNANRTKAIEECNLRKAAFYEQYPRAAEIETELAATAIQAARAVLNGAQAKEQLTLLKQKTFPYRTNACSCYKKQDFPKPIWSLPLLVTLVKMKALLTAGCAVV